MTLEEFKTDWREKETRRNPDIKVTCICGKHTVDFEPATDEVLEYLYSIINEDCNGK